MILAIETSTKFGGVVLYNRGSVLSVKRFTGGVNASETLLPAISELLAEQTMQLGDLSSIAVTIGPGSFTGLRVGLTAAKTLAYFNQLPVFAVPTLDVLALPAQVPGSTIAALMDARKGEVYGAVYRVTQSMERVSEFCVCSIEQFLEGQTDVIITGNAINLYREKIEAICGSSVRFTDEGIWYPDPVTLAQCADNGSYPVYRGEALFSLAPLYIRKSEAEIQWAKTHGSDHPGLSTVDPDSTTGKSSKKT
jgi:tRNA threonylcarbamoyladenosine biosynthesis protein TsaB